MSLNTSLNKRYLEKYNVLYEIPMWFTSEQVSEITGTSVEDIRSYCKEGMFPDPAVEGPNYTFWRRTDVGDWIHDKIRPTSIDDKTENSININEASRITGVPRSEVLSYCEGGPLPKPTTRIPRKLRMRIKAVDEFFSGNNENHCCG